jgi:dipeptidase
MWKAFGTVAFGISAIVASTPDQCTSIAVDYKAMDDGSAIATHNDDCNECDIRVTHVPARDWPAGSLRPVFSTRPPYPR